MSVEFISAVLVREWTAHIEAARAAVTDQFGNSTSEDPSHWEAIFEANAAHLLRLFTRVHLPPGFVVRYRFYGRQERDLLVRPFVARAATDVTVVRSLLDWHAAPDTIAASLRSVPTQDVDLLYRHFSFERTAAGYFEYWIAMQEVWASARWIHSRVIADADDFARTSQSPGWSVPSPLERFEPAVILDDSGGAHLAALVHCPLDTQTIALQQVRIGSDQAIEFVESMPIAHGPRGYVM